MTQADAVKAIFDRWKSLWPTLSSGVAYTFEDVKADEPDDAPFAHVGVTDGDSFEYTIGPSGTQQRTSYIQVDLSGPANKGRGQLDALIQIVRRIYERKRFATDPGVSEFGVVTYAASARPSKNAKDAGQLRRMTVLIPCEWYEQTPAP